MRYFNYSFKFISLTFRKIDLSIISQMQSKSSTMESRGFYTVPHSAWVFIYSFFHLSTEVLISLLTINLQGVIFFYYLVILFSLYCASPVFHSPFDLFSSSTAQLYFVFHSFITFFFFDTSLGSSFFTMRLLYVSKRRLFMYSLISFVFILELLCWYLDISSPTRCIQV